MLLFSTVSHTMQPSTSATLPQHTSHTVNHTVDGSYFQHFLLSLFACWVAINFLAPSSSHAVRSPSLPLPSVPSVPADPIHPPSGPTAGDLAAYNFFSYSQSRLLDAIRVEARAATSVQVRLLKLPPSVHHVLILAYYL
jgi:hypothetical protein